MAVRPFVSAARLLRLIRSHRQSGRARRDRLWTHARVGGATQRPPVEDGVRVPVTATHLTAVGPEELPTSHTPWWAIARENGLHESVLRTFNHTGRTNDTTNPWKAPRVPALRVGSQVYVPSTDEVLLAQCIQAASGHVAVGYARYAALAGTHHRSLLKVGRLRASGRRGLGYRNTGLDGIFLSPNPDLAGASHAPGRWERLDGIQEFRVQWAPDFWKCSVYLQDVVHHAGWRAHITAHKHYLVAGRVHTSPHFAAHPLAQAAPGDVWQRWGGDGVDDSHTGVLASFVEVRPLPGETHRGHPLDAWTFHLLGAEKDGAGESIRDQIVLRGSDETPEGKRIRFFSPALRR